MRSIYAKILAWAAVTVALASAGFVATFWYLSQSRTEEARFFGGIIALQRDGAAAAYREGGAEGLRSYLARMGTSFEGDHYLLDPQGRDLVDGRPTPYVMFNNLPRTGDAERFLELLRVRT